MADQSPLGRAALAYAEHGWFIAPVTYGTKDQPLTPHGFKDASRNPAHIRAWVTRFGRCNWMLWPAPSGLLVVDWETAAGEATMREWSLWDVPTLRVISDRGAHHYFQAPATDVGTSSLGPGTTVRHRKGYVLLPPSAHPSGHIYRWESTLDDLRPLPEAITARLVLDEPAAPVRPMPRPAAAWSKLPPALERRIRAYLDRLPVGLRDGGGRNTVGYRLAAFLVRDLQLGDALALQWLEEWNARQAEPLGARELATVLANGHAYGHHSYGSGLERRRAS